MMKVPAVVLIIVVAAVGFCADFIAAETVAQKAAETVAQKEVDKPVSYGRDVRPILSDKCYKCHGPDEQAREADLRLDREEEAADVLSRENPADSELTARITSDDPDQRMPPAGSKLVLSTGEIDVLRRWVQQKSPYQRHWSFEPIRAPEVPRIDGQDWTRNEIDQFILARLNVERLQPSEPAGRERLIRRLSFDLIGLPPTIEEIDAFLSDTSDDAYERLVDRLLDREEYGERMAVDWLDTARYSDTYGYQVDRDRYVWPWRDWVIRAFNRNLPYDQFIVWQLAGDLLPNATDEQILATTFNRLHPQKVEGGSVPEEFRVEYVADRNHTVATAFLGLTLECAHCHDHKYDPISQKEYYQLFAFFNNIDEAGLYSYHTDAIPTPTLQLADDVTKARLDDLDRRVAAAEQAVRRTAIERKEIAHRWLDDRPSLSEIPGRIVHLGFEHSDLGGNRNVPGQVGKAIELTGDDGYVVKKARFHRYQPFTVGLWLNTPDVKQRAVVFHHTAGWTDAGSRGYQLLIEQGKLSWSLIHFWPGNALRIVTESAIPTDQWLHVTVTSDGSSRADGLQIYVNGQPAACDVVRDNLTKTIFEGGGDSLIIGERNRDRGFTKGKIDEFQVFDRTLTAVEIMQLHDDQSLAKALATPKPELTPAQTARLVNYYFATIDVEFRQRISELQTARQQKSDALDGIQEIMVMRELPRARPSFLLQRGAYDAPADPVRPDTPGIFPPLPEDRPRDRLALARWLVRPDHPLTARVAANRVWQMCFGKGLVRTPEDFGSQGSPPTHPELLDWLADDFMNHGWDLKRLIKKVVTSAAYRQQSLASPELLQRDPENVLLARGPRYRLSAEMLRDNALAVSGGLVNQVGGSPTRPYEVAESFKPVKVDEGNGLYRRSLYTFWKRTAPAPVMMALDASNRDVCSVRREQTSSPLQAFVLLNDPQFVEAARLLGQKMLRKHEDDQEAIIDEIFRLLTSRRPGEKEQTILRRLYSDQLQYFNANPNKAEEYLKVGRAGWDEKIAAARLAAVGVLAAALMNYDECVMKR